MMRVKLLLSKMRYLIYILDMLMLFVIGINCIKFIGIDTREILSGSMEPILSGGDVVYIKEANIEDIKIGDIVAYKLEDSTIVHRVISRTTDGLITKGDAVSQEDGATVTSDMLEGIVIFQLDNGIAFYTFISSNAFKVLLVMLILFNLLL